MVSVSPFPVPAPPSAPPRRTVVLVAGLAPDTREQVQRVLQPEHDVVLVADADGAMAALCRQPVDVVLVDAATADGSRASLPGWMKADARLRATPVILTFPRADAAPDPGVLRLADDVLATPCADCELGTRVRVQVELARVRRECDDRVRESEERFRHVADHSPLMFWVTEPDGRCSYLNQRWYEFTGQAQEEALGLGWINAVHPDDRARLKQEFLRANAAQANFRAEYRLCRHDGAYRRMIDSAAPRFFKGRYAGYVGSVIDITDEREERESLARERSQMELALRAGRIGTFEWDIPSGRVVWSPELEALYGLAPGTFERSFRAWTQRVVPEDVTRVEVILRRCFERKLEETEYEFRIVLPDGSLRWLEGKARFSFGANGTPRRMVGINIDIDERKQHELNATFLNHLTHEIALLSDPQAILSTVEQEVGRHLAAHRCYFLTSNEAATHAVVEQDWVRDAGEKSLSGTYPLSSFGPSEIWSHITTRTVAIEDVTVHPVTEHSATTYRSLRMAAWASAPFMRDGRWVASLVIADDRPRRWRDDEIQLVETVLARMWPLIERARSEQAVTAAEAKIRESEERLRVTVQAARLGTWDFNPLSGELVWDARCKELFGLPPEAGITWELFLERIHPDDRGNVRQAASRALQADGGGEFDIEARTTKTIAGAARWLRASGQAFFNPQGQPTRFIGTVIDISDLVKARETLAERRVELERLVAERTAKLQETVAELEGFSYSISHDLRAPLRAMQSFAQILTAECSEAISPAGRDYLRRISAASDRMDRLIHDVLVYSRVSRTELQLDSIDLEQLIDGIVESYPQLQPRGADIVIRRPLDRVLGNEAALTQCFSNLIGNAVKFVAPTVRPRVELWTEVHGSRVRLFVRDNGIGIDAAAHEKIFGIFERLSRDYDGTGIGLAVVRKAAERMGGTVSVHSTPGAGSTFCLELEHGP